MVDTHLFLNKCQGTNLLDQNNEHDGHGNTLPARGARSYHSRVDRRQSAGARSY